MAAILAYNAGRDPERLAIKYRKMRKNSFAFLRGSCHRFYQCLPEAEVLDAAPVTWVCGDLHLENYGSYKGDHRQPCFDINDFDESALAPCSWDLVRFLTSILLAGDGLSLERHAALLLCRSFLLAYRNALMGGKAKWVEGATATGMVQALLDHVAERNRPDFLDARTEKAHGIRRIRLDGKKALPATGEERARMERLLRAFAADAPTPDFFRVLDVARRIAGTGSLGAERYVVLVEGKGSPDANYFIDVKRARPSSLLPRLHVTQPAWENEAQRIVAIQQRMQAVSAAFLHAVPSDDGAYVVRGLQPSEDKIDLDAWQAFSDLEGVIRSMGEILAWDQLRSSGRDGSAIADELIEFGRQEVWCGPLIEVAEHCAAAGEQDWRAFALAFDDGLFGRPPP